MEHCDLGKEAAGNSFFLLLVEGVVKDQVEARDCTAGVEVVPTACIVVDVSTTDGKEYGQEVAKTSTG